MWMCYLTSTSKSSLEHKFTVMVSSVICMRPLKNTNGKENYKLTKAEDSVLVCSNCVYWKHKPACIFLEVGISSLTVCFQVYATELFYMCLTEELLTSVVFLPLLPTGTSLYY